ncbi:MAG: type I 3-dehydroquinate dehydratase [Holophagales bacterium]|nr:type I 3-dehydroquinate dehydratase [Holophagales bacterium]
MGLTALTAEKTLLLASLGRETNAGLIEASRLVDARIPAVEVRLDALREAPELRPSARRSGAGPSSPHSAREAKGDGSKGRTAEAAALLGAALDAGFDLADVEFARAGARLFGLPGERVVVSAHDVAGVPEDLEERVERMESTGARYVKAVATARGLDDALRLLRLQSSRGEGRLSVFGMGEAGLVTRALSPYLGAALSYGSALPGEATAPGQLLAADLLDVYAVGRPRRVGALFALLGGRVSHSFSPAIHNSAFEALGIAGALRSCRPRVAERRAFAASGSPDPIRPAAARGVCDDPVQEGSLCVRGRNGWERREHPPLRRGWHSDGHEYGPGRASRRDSRGAGIGRRPRPRGGRNGARRRRGAPGARLGRRRDGSDAGACRGPRGRPRRARRRESGGLGTPVRSGGERHALGLDAADPLPVRCRTPLPGVVALDAPYRPGGTAFSHEARRRGARLVDGFALLLSQAAGQSALFTGRPADAASSPRAFRPDFAPFSR